MTDRRFTPANGRVAHVSLRGRVQAARFTEGAARSVCAPVADLRESPDGARDRQLLFGDLVLLLEERDGFGFVWSQKDGYAGYVALAALGPEIRPTHWVAAPATHLYAAPDIKAPEVMALPFGARLAVEPNGVFAETADGGFVPSVHLKPVGAFYTDPVAVAEMFLGTPYLWGGNSRQGLDCSGLVQAALMACGQDCPPDSDMQMHLGAEIAPEAPLVRGDLLFWAGHVALVVDRGTLIHANAHHMAVAHEPTDAAIARIAAQGDGPVIARRRVHSRV